MKAGRKIFITVFIAILLACAALSLYASGVFSDYFSSPRNFTIEYMADGSLVGTTNYNVESDSVNEPSVPTKSGYEGKWEEYSLTAGGDLTVNAVYEPINYALTFVGPSGQVANYVYNIEGVTTLRQEPTVPKYMDMKGEWEEYVLEGSVGDKVVSALYTSKDATDGLEYSYKPLKDGYYVTGYNGSDANVVIPECYKNKKVLGISAQAFVNNYTVLSVTLPSTLTSIAERSFVDCKKLVAVYNNSSVPNQSIKDGITGLGSAFNIVQGTVVNDSAIVTQGNFYFSMRDGVNYLIGYCGTKYERDVVLPQSFDGEEYQVYDYAFYENDDILSITVPTYAKLTKIGKKAFANCDKLTNVNLGNVPEIDASALHKTPAVNEISVSSYNANYTVAEGKLVDTLNGVILKATKTASLPLRQTGAFANVTGIEDYAFMNNEMSELILPYFYNQIGFGAFEGCNEVLEVIVDNAEFLRNYLGYYFGAETYSESSKYLPKTLTKVTVGDQKLGDNVDELNIQIADYALYNCENLTEVIFGNDVVAVGMKAFGGCNNLKYLTLSVEGGGTDASYSYYFENNANKIVDLTLTDKVAHVANNALSEFRSLKTISLPFIGNSISDISSKFNCLFGYSASKNGGIPTLLEVVEIRGGTTINADAFANCESIKDITISSQVESVGARAFQGCTSLISFPTNFHNVKTINQLAFNGCTSLKGNLKYEVELVGENAFLGSGLTVTTSEMGTYYGLENADGEVNPYYLLTNIDEKAKEFTINSETQVVADKVVANCTKLYRLTLTDGVKYIAQNAFTGNGEPINIYEVYDLNSSIVVNKGYTNNGYLGYHAYKIHTSSSSPSIVYEDKAGLIFVDNSSELILVKYIGTDTELNVVSPLNGRTYSIASSVFTSKNITKISMSDVDAIGTRCFAGCTKLQEVTIGGTLTVLSESLFQSCTKLESINLENADGIQTISRYAFSTCSSLTQIKMPNSLTSINSYAFSNCKGLTEVYIKSPVVVQSNAFSNCKNLIILCQASTSQTIASQNSVGYILYGVESESICKYVFETNGGSVIESKTQWYLNLNDADNENVTAIPTPTKAGYRFEGWYLDKECLTNPISQSYFYAVGEVTLYAKWAEN